MWLMCCQVPSSYKSTQTEILIQHNSTLSNPPQCSTLGLGL